MTRSGLRTGSQPIVAVIDPGVIRRERFVLPLWATLAGITLRALTRTLVTLVRVAVRCWPATTVLAAIAVLWRGYGAHSLLTAGLVATVLAWAVLAWLRLLSP